MTIVYLTPLTSKGVRARCMMWLRVQTATSNSGETPSSDEWNVLLPLCQRKRNVFKGYTYIVVVVVVVMGMVMMGMVVVAADVVDAAVVAVVAVVVDAAVDVDIVAVDCCKGKKKDNKEIS